MAGGDFGEFGQDPLDFMSPQQMAAFALGSDAVVNGGAQPSAASQPFSPAVAAAGPGLGMDGARGQVRMAPAAALSRPAMSAGTNLDMGAPPAPSIAGPAPMAPMQPVIRTASQPNLPLPQAPGVDPRRAQLEQQASTLRQPLDKNAAQFRPHWYDYLKAVALGALGGVGHRPDLSAAAGERAVSGKYIDANTKRLQQLGAAEQDISAIDKTQQGEQKQFENSMDIYKGALGQRREDRAEEAESRRQDTDERRVSNEDRRLTAVEEAEKDRRAKDSAADKRATQKETDEAAHRKQEEEHWRRQDTTADRNASTRENNEKDRAARYAGVKGADKGKIDKVYSDRDKAIAKLDSEKSRSQSGLTFLPDGPTKQKQQKSIEDDYNSRVQKIHDSTKQRVEQLGGKYDNTTDNQAGSGKYKTGDKVSSGKYAGYFVHGVDSQGNYQLSKSAPK